MTTRTNQVTAPVIDSVAEFKRCCIVYNTNSTNAVQVRQRIEALKQVFPPEACTLVQTSPDGLAANQELLHHMAGELGSDTLLAIAGGDGTVNLAVDTLLYDPRFTAEQRQTVILPLWGGNGNDLAYMLNGAPGRMPLPVLLESGKRVAIYPLRCEITVETSTSAHAAICYASFGASAFAAQQLEGLRGGRSFWYTIGAARFMYELGTVSRAMWRASRFTVEDGAATHPVFDRLFINGSRYAKVNRVPQKLTDQQFFYVTVEQKRVSSVAFHLAEIVRKHPARYVVADGRAISFVLQEATWAQIDGEVTRLAAGTRVRIGLSEQPFYALSTLLSS